MYFRIEYEPTMDDSIPIIVSHLSNEHEEYIFQFACNKKELKQLISECKKGLKQLEKLKKLREKNGMCKM